MKKILIANRGEIAVRVMRTAKSLGYRTVAVYSEADVDCLHVNKADEAICIGPAIASESYLAINKILQAAAKTGADAIHPGYGFLSENAAFAKACEEAGITFIGPQAETIELMGSKRLSKIAMQEADVPYIPGYQGSDQGEATLTAKAIEIGFPVMVKASAGGGGRGMRLVSNQHELIHQLKSARSEAEKAFGDDELILEKALIEPRHIEIQIFADNFGNVVHLFERDCSIQRRHQKVIEESPSPFVDDTLRDKMGDAAVKAAKYCGYRGAGTVEFLVDQGKNFYFLEMNTRLQVEHPVTELVTGQDLVAWQLMVAEGEKLPLTQNELTMDGHAIEARLYAEDPRQDFMPQTGKILHWQAPTREGIRIDGGIRSGQNVTIYYDPMLAKFCAHGPSRKIAINRLSSIIEDTVLLGLNNNKLFLQNIMQNSLFKEGGATTAFIEQHFHDDESMKSMCPPMSTLALAAALFAMNNNNHNLFGAWDSAYGSAASLKLECNRDPYHIQLTFKRNVFQATCNNETVKLKVLERTGTRCTIEEDCIQKQISFTFQHETLFLDDGNGHFEFTDVTYAPAQKNIVGGNGQIKAPIDGAITDVCVTIGEQVKIGQVLIVMEAMKMEHSLEADLDGAVEELTVTAGTQVKKGQLLATMKNSCPQAACSPDLIGAEKT